MANEQNLIPQAHTLTVEEASKGGKNSVESRKNKKMLRECLEILLEKEMKGKNGETITGAEALTTKLFSEALKGNIKAFEVIRDTAGQKPVERIMVADVEQSVIDDVERMVNDEQR